MPSTARRGAATLSFANPEVRARWGRAASHLLLGAIPVLSVPILGTYFARTHIFALDFHTWYWPAGNQLLHSKSLYLRPYPWAFYYPAIGALLFVPFALVPHAVADGIFATLVLLAVPGTLRILKVTDWRVYGAAMLWPPVVFGWQTANLSILLALGVAAAWHLRRRAVLAGVLVGVLLSVKLFLWPLGLWFLATRRYKALAAAAASAVTLTLVGFGVLGFAEIPHYARALHSFLAHAQTRSYSLTAFVLHLGGTHELAYAIALVAVAALGTATVLLGRRGHDRQALTACIVASLLASPMVEAHYLVVLLVPLALACPEFSGIWLLPLVLWLTPADWPAQWQRAMSLSIVLVVTILILSRPTRTEEPPLPAPDGPRDILAPSIHL